MNTKIILVLVHLLISVYATSRYRYNNRALRIHRPRFERLTMAQNCSYGICEDANYPEDEVRNIVNKHESFHSFLTGNVIKPSKGVSFHTRDGEEGKSFCKTRDVVSTPKLMIDIHHTEKRIVNVKDYRQILNYQICDLEEGECFNEVILDTTTKCVQKFNNIKLVTVNVTYGVLEYSIFRIPTTCVCTYAKKHY